MSNVKDFLKRKDIVITPQRYLIEALGAMAHAAELRPLCGAGDRAQISKDCFHR